MRNPLSVLKALVSFVRLVRDPNRLNEVFNLANQIADPKAARPMADAIAEDELGARALRERHRLGRIDLAELQSLPAGTLGRAFAEHMLSNGLDPAAIPTRNASDELEFVLAHLYESHDIWHVVTGLGVDVAGELGLQAFYMAQMPARLSPLILTAGVLNTLLYQPNEWHVRLDAITRGWILGKRARPLFGVRWDDHWAKPLDVIRKRFSVGVPTVDTVIVETSSRSKGGTPARGCCSAARTLPRGRGASA